MERGREMVSEQNCVAKCCITGGFFGGASSGGLFGGQQAAGIMGLGQPQPQAQQQQQAPSVASAPYG